jgi:antitoxin CptB
MPELPPTKSTSSARAASESRDNRIRRLIYRSSYTGTKETDTLLGAFAREVLPALSDDHLDLYEDLLEYGDPAIWSWVSGQAEVPANVKNAVLDRLIIWCQDRKPL